LPLEELKRFNVAPEEILQFEDSPRFRSLARSVAERARGFYHSAREALPEEDRRAMGTAELMGSVYWRLLTKLEQRDFNVLAPVPARLNKFQKLALILRTWYRVQTGAVVPNYGAT
jgi:phytoene synthase